MTSRLGIDLGGTKIEVAVVAADDSVRMRERIATPQADYRETLKAIAALIERAEAATGDHLGHVGIGTPGSISPATGLMRNANSTCLNGERLQSDLEGLTGRSIRMANDANCFALAEAVSGAGRGHQTVFGVIVGTGVGGGVVINGRTLLGRNAIGGEWGHNPLPAPLASELPGPLCYCGRRGCIETWCSGPAIAADHLQRTGADMPAEMIAGVAAAGDMDAIETLDKHRDRLGRALAGVVNILDPDVIVLGGGLSKMPGLAEKLPDAMRAHVFSDSFETPVVVNQLGDSAGVIGAAWLWPLEDVAKEVVQERPPTAAKKALSNSERQT
ncbi:MAG: ROK family protein [Pseudomonadota bacterium]